jgi:endonuclease/exonuclease/phosphatase family metal-dependent hydrolase
MRIATYNVEWFNALFDSRDRLIPDRKWSGRQGVRRGEQAEALGRVFRTLDADAVLVVEAPDQNPRRSTVAALEGFAAAFGLRTRKALIGFGNETQQELALLYDPDRLTARHDPGESPEAPRFDGSFEIDLDTDARPEAVSFSKPPLELSLETAAGRHLRLIGVHIKSKAPHGARGPAEITRLAIDNRRKQVAQCIWLRARVEERLVAGDSLIVLGDFNDGPGLDEYEKLFGRSGIEIVLGENGGPYLHDPHARMILTRRAGAVPSSARFFIVQDGRYLSALLDYIMVSEDLDALKPAWRIWHPFDDPVCWEDAGLRQALLAASDHFPVTIDLPV